MTFGHPFQPKLFYNLCPFFAHSAAAILNVSILTPPNTGKRRETKIQKKCGSAVET